MEIRIRELRNKRGLSQQQLAKKINISSQNISRYERKERLPDIDTIISLAKALDVPLTEMFYFDDEKFQYGYNKTHEEKVLAAFAAFDKDDQEKLLSVIQKLSKKELDFISRVKNMKSEDENKLIKIVELIFDI